MKFVIASQLFGMVVRLVDGAGTECFELQDFALGGENGQEVLIRSDGILHARVSCMSTTASSKARQRPHW